MALIRVPQNRTYPYSQQTNPGDVVDFGDFKRLVNGQLDAPIVFPNASGLVVQNAWLVDTTPKDGCRSWWRNRKAHSGNPEFANKPCVRDAGADNDGIRFSNQAGLCTVLDSRFEGWMDPIGPAKDPDTARSAKTVIKRCWFERINDDIIENDAALNSELEDCLCDNVRVFYSCRPSAGFGGSFPSSKAIITRCIVSLGFLPDDRADHQDVPHSWGGPRPGPNDVGGPENSVSMLWKWSQAADLHTVQVKDCIFLVPAMSRNGPGSMGFPNGTYENCKLIWLGGGSYPGSLPASGVTVSSNRAIYDNAKANWIRTFGSKWDDVLPPGPGLVVNDDEYEMLEDEVLELTPLLNDSADQGAIMRISAVGAPSAGTVVGFDDGSITYQAPAVAPGSPVTLSYTVVDTLLRTDTGNIEIAVTDVPPDPTPTDLGCGCEPT